MLETKNEEINRLKTDLKKKEIRERQLLENNLSNDEGRSLKKSYGSRKKIYNQI